MRCSCQPVASHPVKRELKDDSEHEFAKLMEEHDEQLQAQQVSVHLCPQANEKTWSLDHAPLPYLFCEALLC